MLFTLLICALQVYRHSSRVDEKKGRSSGDKKSPRRLFICSVQRRPSLSFWFILFRFLFKKDFHFDVAVSIKHFRVLLFLLYSPFPFPVCRLQEVATRVLNNLDRISMNNYPRCLRLGLLKSWNRNLAGVKRRQIFTRLPHSFHAYNSECAYCIMQTH